MATGETSWQVATDEEEAHSGTDYNEEIAFFVSSSRRRVREKEKRKKECVILYGGWKRTKKWQSVVMSPQINNTPTPLATLKITGIRVPKKAHPFRV